MKIAIQCNIGISEYNELTPYELNLIAETHSDQLIESQKERLILTWLGEYYHRQKKLPSLQNALKEFFDDTKEKRVMSDDEMFKKAQQLNALFQGTVI